MAKSYVPQLVRKLRLLAVYITKHNSTMGAYLSAQQQSDLNSILTMLNDFVAVVTRETP